MAQDRSAGGNGGARLGLTRARALAGIEDTLSVLDKGTPLAHGCRRQSVKLPTANIAATAAVPAHGSQGGVKRFPNTSEAALRTRGPVIRCRS